MEEHRGNDLSDPFFATRRLQWRQRPLSLSLSPSLCLYRVTLYTHTTTKVFNNLFVFALSHIYTHMTFGLFTHMAPRGSLGHIYIWVPSNRSSGLPPGLRSSGSPWLPIRRDLFPNKLLLHSGMACSTSLIRFRHASCLSGVSTLVSMSDPFSAVWILVSTNSRSSTRSRIK